MSKYKLWRDAPGTGPLPKRDMTARAKIIEKYGAKTMIGCTAMTCNILGGLMDEWQLAQDEKRYRDATAIWKRIQEHNRGPECQREQVTK